MEVISSLIYFQKMILHFQRLSAYFKRHSIELLDTNFNLILLSITKTVLLTRIVTGSREKAIPATDKRIQMMDEIICGIQIIKMYAWEKPFGALIQKLRR